MLDLPPIEMIIIIEPGFALEYVYDEYTRAGWKPCSNNTRRIPKRWEYIEPNVPILIWAQGYKVPQGVTLAIKWDYVSSHQHNDYERIANDCYEHLKKLNNESYAPIHRVNDRFVRPTLYIPNPVEPTTKTHWLVDGKPIPYKDMSTLHLVGYLKEASTNWDLRGGEQYKGILDYFNTLIKGEMIYIPCKLVPWLKERGILINVNREVSIEALLPYIGNEDISNIIELYMKGRT